MEISLNSKLQEMWSVGSYTVNMDSSEDGLCPWAPGTAPPTPSPHHVGIHPPGVPGTAPLTPCPPPITWASCFRGIGHSPAYVLPPVMQASPSRWLDGSRMRWLLLGCVLLESEGPASP